MTSMKITGFFTTLPRLHFGLILIAKIYSNSLTAQSSFVHGPLRIGAILEQHESNDMNES